MNYTMRDYQGNELIVTEQQAVNIANVSGLLEIEVDGYKHYVNPKNVSGMQPIIPSKFKLEDYV